MNLRLLQTGIKEQFKQYWFTFSIIVVGIVYICFPNTNPMFDSLGYGGNVKYGIDLFSAHHLLYECVNYVVLKIVASLLPTTDALRSMQLVNAIFALFNLYLIRKIILYQTLDKKKSKLWTLFVAATFGFMRFSVEAEVYIIPISFSLLSSLYYLKFLKTSYNRNILVAGFFASIACLFHQIHLFWGIGLFVGLLFNKKLKPIFYYLLSTPLVLLSYSLVLVYYNNIEFSFSNLYHFLAQYYYTDGADVGVGISNVLITAIAFFRTFFQVHGVVVELLRLTPLLYTVIPLVLALIIYSTFVFIKSVKLVNKRFENANFERTHLIVFILQFAFAFFSNGNSEFMVMLPFLIALFIPYLFNFDSRTLFGLSAAMLIWNFSFCIYPNSKYNFMNNKMLAKVIHDNPDKIFVLKEGGFVCNQYFYMYGHSPRSRVFEVNDDIALSNLATHKVLVLTDVLSKRIPYNRNSYMGGYKTKSKFVFVKHQQFIDSSLGGYFVDVVLLK